MTTEHYNLEKISDYKSLLKNYHPSEEVVESLESVLFVLLSAPTAAGRNTLIQQLLKTNKYHYVVSDTTRQPRVNNGVVEKTGTEYWFRSEDEFLNGLKKGQYLEAAVIHNQQVSGININELQTAKNTNKVAITDIDIQGCDTIVGLSNNTLPIFILPPSYEEWMKRLDGRGEMSEEEKRRRLASAEQEIAQALQRPYFRFVTNWDLTQTAEFLDNHITSRNFLDDEQREEKEHAQNLLKSLLSHRI